MGSRLAAVLHPNTNSLSAEECRYRLEEAIRLTESLGLEVFHAETCSINRVKPGTLIGLGKVEEFSKLCCDNALEVVIINTALTPIQQRNLERLMKVKVLDRTALILEIFGARARTKEGTLQVELAALTYQKSRLVRSWTHLERQRGGLGFIGGPGESQMELDRRMISTRMRVLMKEIEKVKKTRTLHRKKREAIPYDIVALVGYTNAGKSTLFNSLTGANVFEKDLLFATLDPTLRAATLPSGRQVIFSDTVGFVSDLPHELIAAFQATLEEVQSAQVILHVQDCSHPEMERYAAEVNKVLTILGISSDDPRILMVYNKADLLTPERKKEIQEGEYAGSIFISAPNKATLAPLVAAVDQRLSEKWQALSFSIPYDRAEVIAWVHRHGKVVQKQEEDHACAIVAEFSARSYAYAKKTFSSFICAASDADSSQPLVPA